jgi:hypothetical protein
MRCAGTHRGLGAHTSKVRGVGQIYWLPELVVRFSGLLFSDLSNNPPAESPAVQYVLERQITPATFLPTIPLQQVRSCTLDTWLPEQVVFMAQTGNAHRLILQNSLPGSTYAL